MWHNGWAGRATRGRKPKRLEVGDDRWGSPVGGVREGEVDRACVASWAKRRHWAERGKERRGEEKKAGWAGWTEKKRERSRERDGEKGWVKHFIFFLVGCYIGPTA
jgi:hypothetical protein